MGWSILSYSCSSTLQVVLSTFLVSVAQINITDLLPQTNSWHKNPQYSSTLLLSTKVLNILPIPDPRREKFCRSGNFPAVAADVRLAGPISGDLYRSRLIIATCIIVSLRNVHRGIRNFPLERVEFFQEARVTYFIGQQDAMFESIWILVGSGVIFGNCKYYRWRCFHRPKSPFFLRGHSM